VNRSACCSSLLLLTPAARLEPTGRLPRRARATPQARRPPSLFWRPPPARARSRTARCALTVRKVAAVPVYEDGAVGRAPQLVAAREHGGEQAGRGAQRRHGRREAAAAHIERDLVAVGEDLTGHWRGRRGRLPRCCLGGCARRPYCAPATLPPAASVAGSPWHQAPTGLALAGKSAGASFGPGKKPLPLPLPISSWPTPCSSNAAAPTS
jgi:hypothetical protein